MSDLAQWKVHGPVRTLKTELAEWDLNQEQWRPPRGVTQSAFRPDGNISESEYHNPDGSVAHRKWLYDEAGRLTETQFRMNDAPPDRVLYSYDSAGRHIRTERVHCDGTRRESEASSYDRRGRKTKVCFLPPHDPTTPTSYGVEGTEHAYGAPGATTMTVAYDERQQPAEVRFHDAHQTLVRRVTFVRDGAGRLLSEEMHMGEQMPFPEFQETLKNASPLDRARAAALFTKLFSPNQAFTSTTYEYDPHGCLLVRSRRMAGLSEERTCFRYDEHDNPIEETTEHNRREVGIDEHGEMRTSSENSDREQTRFEYKYDAHGNWTERVVSIRFGPNSDFQRSNVERREITYHAAAPPHPLS